MYVSSVYLCVFVCEHVNVSKYVFVPVFLSLCLSTCVCMYPGEYVFGSVGGWRGGYKRDFTVLYWGETCDLNVFTGIPQMNISSFFHSSLPFARICLLAPKRPIHSSPDSKCRNFSTPRGQLPSMVARTNTGCGGLGATMRDRLQPRRTGT